MSYTVIAKSIGDIFEKFPDGMTSYDVFEAVGIDKGEAVPYGKIKFMKTVFASFSLKPKKHQQYEITYQEQPQINDGLLIGEISSIKLFVEESNGKSNSKTEDISELKADDVIINVITNIFRYTIEEFKRKDARPDWEHWNIGYSSTQQAPNSASRCVFMKVNTIEADKIFNHLKELGAKECPNMGKGNNTAVKQKFIWIYHTR